MSAKQKKILLGQAQVVGIGFEIVLLGILVKDIVRGIVQCMASIPAKAWSIVEMAEKFFVSMFS